MRNSVLQTWVEELPWKAQSTLFSGFRGPDDFDGPHIKAVVKWIRSVSQHDADPSTGYMSNIEYPSPTALTRELDYCSNHFLDHFRKALEVIEDGYPDTSYKGTARAYIYACEAAAAD